MGLTHPESPGWRGRQGLGCLSGNETRKPGAGAGTAEEHIPKGLNKAGHRCTDSQCVVRMLDSFDHPGPNGVHLVMVFEVRMREGQGIRQGIRLADPKSRPWISGGSSSRSGWGKLSGVAGVWSMAWTDRASFV